MHAFTHTHTRTLRTSYSVHCKYLCRSDSTGIEFHSTEKVTAIHVFVQLYASYPMYSVQVHMSMDIELPRIADRRRGHRLRLRLSGTHCTGYVVCPEKKITTIDGKRQYRKESCLFTLQSSVVGYHIECLLMSLQILLPHPDFCLSSGNVIKKNIKKRTK